MGKDPRICGHSTKQYHAGVISKWIVTINSSLRLLSSFVGEKMPYDLNANKTKTFGTDVKF